MPAFRTRPAARRRVVLLAEDEALLAGLLGDLLAAEGFEVVLAADGLEALERAGRRHVDVLLTDLDMPRLGGRELIRRLRAGRPALPVVVMTGRLPSEDGDALIGGPGSPAEPFALLAKPFAPERLIEAVRRVLAGQACLAAVG
nr:response regulator [Caldovatus aquaticus]